MKAIETEYKGVLFRSRLEARWAVFFEELEIRWEYEAEAFDLGGAIRYLPDFRLQVPGGGLAWFEVKPPEHGFAQLVEMFSKPDRLALESGEQVLLAFGEPADCRLFVCGTPRCRLSYRPYFYMASRFAPSFRPDLVALELLLAEGAAQKARTHRFWNPKERR